MNRPSSSAREAATGAEAPSRSGIPLVGTIAVLLLAIGGLNWGLVGLADFNLVEWVFGGASFASRVVYVVVGVAAVYCLLRLSHWSRAS